MEEFLTQKEFFRVWEKHEKCRGKSREDSTIRLDYIMELTVFWFAVCVWISKKRSKVGFLSDFREKFISHFDRKRQGFDVRSVFKILNSSCGGCLWGIRRHKPSMAETMKESLARPLLNLFYLKRWQSLIDQIIHQIPTSSQANYKNTFLWSVWGQPKDVVKAWIWEKVSSSRASIIPHLIGPVGGEKCEAWLEPAAAILPSSQSVFIVRLQDLWFIGMNFFSAWIWINQGVFL